MAMLSVTVYNLQQLHGESKNMKNIFVELLHCTLKKVNPWADSTLCKNQEPTDWYTQREVVMALKHAARPGSITNGGTGSL